tara:strand:+ start:378 stop:989 length:612 start_codon:yes stop_codon:yes gene_type:complete
MKKKTFFQILILSIILITLFIFFQIYFTDKGNVNQESSKLNKSTKIVQDFSQKQENEIKNIEYTSVDLNGNKYTIASETGYLSDDSSEKIIMQKVVGEIVFGDSSTLDIVSDNALYNVINYNTNFYDNVFLTYNDHLINSDDLNLIMSENMLTISGNIIYKKQNTIMYADKVEMDIISKDLKIFMNKESEKIKILNNNTNGNN